MLNTLKTKVSLKVPKKKMAIIKDFFVTHYQSKPDPWGFNPSKALKILDYVWPFYKHYFKVRVFGKENVEQKPYMIVANHSGQIAIDGLLISAAFVLDLEPPRLVRPMIERFLPAAPFIGQWTLEAGAVLGDRANCIHLLQHGESVLIFPEGLRGITKNTQDFYKLQEFTRGFFRLALQTGVEILPIAVVGAEEFYPFVHHAKKLARFLKLPALPITPLFPWLGPLGILPLPSPVDIIVGKPHKIPENLSSDSPDKLIDEHVFKIEQTIKDMLEEGLKERRPFWANIKGKKGE